MQKTATATGLTLLLLLAACGSSETGDFTTEVGESGSNSVDQSSGEMEMTITTDEGVATVRSGSDVPVNLPLGFSLYPGAEVTSNSMVDHNGGQGAMVLFTSTDDPEAVLEFYRGQAEAAGIDVVVDMKVNDGGMLGGEGENGTSFTINANKTAAGTDAQLMVGDQLGS